MNSYCLTSIDLKLIDRLATKSEADAPWANMPAQAWDFMRESLSVGLDWRSHEDALNAYLKPTSKAGLKRQAVAREVYAFQDARRMFPAGIGLYDEHVVGRVASDDDDSPIEIARGVVHQLQDVPGKDRQMARLMEVFWPDAPPLVWSQVCDRLVKREYEQRSNFGGYTEDYCIDSMDFGRAFRFLAHAQKLVAHPRIEWDGIIDPAAGVVPRARGGR